MNRAKWMVSTLTAALLAFTVPQSQALAQNPPGDQQQWWNPGDWFDDIPNHWSEPSDFDPNEYDYEYLDDDYEYFEDESNYYGDVEVDDFGYGYDDEYHYTYDDDYFDLYADDGLTETEDWFTDDYWESEWYDDGLSEWDYNDPAWNNDLDYWDDSWD